MRNYQSQYQLKPTPPPKPLKHLLLLIAGVSVCCALYDHFFTNFFGVPNPSMWFSLSTWGIKHFFFWELLTYPFVHSNIGYGLSFRFVIHLLFNLYLLWVFGTGIYEQHGKKGIYGLFFGGTLVAGLAATLFTALSPSHLIFSGALPPLYSIMIAWAVLFPGNTLLLFFSFRIKAKWLILSLLGFELFLNLINRNLLYFSGYLAAILFGYFYALTVWHIYGPFARLRPFEKKIIKSSFKFKKLFVLYSPNSKIVDIKIAQRSQKEDEFMDYCLSKISNKGKASLTWLEKRRMNKISKKNQQFRR